MPVIRHPEDGMEHPSGYPPTARTRPPINVDMRQLAAE